MEFIDQEIEEGIEELERGKFKDLKLEDDISIFGMLYVFIVIKKSNLVVVNV